MTASATSGKGLDELFDEGVDMTEFVVDEATRFPGREVAPRKVNLSMPSWLVDELDASARRLAVPRQAVINLWLAERVERERRALAEA